jgi:hypothetical protein
MMTLIEEPLIERRSPARRVRLRSMTAATDAAGDYPACIAAAFASEVARGGATRRLGLRIGRLSVTLEVAGAELATMLEEALPVSPPGPAGEWTVTALDASSCAEPLPSFPWRPEQVRERGEVRVAGDPEVRAQFDVGDGVLSMFDPRRRRAVYVVPDTGRLSAWQRAAPLRTILSWVIGSRGLVLAHAAAVGDGADGVLITGAGGSGKSTTAVACAAAGLRFAGDDYVALERDGPAATAHCLFQTAKLTPASLRMLPGLEAFALPAGTTDGEKRVVEVGRAYPRAMASSISLSALVLPRVAAGQPTVLRPASATEALRALAPTTMLQVPGAGELTLGRLAALVRVLPAYTLRLGTGSPAPRLIAEFLAERRHQ